MYRYPLDQDRLGAMRLVSVATQEFDGQTSMRDGKPVRVCSILVHPDGDRPEVMNVTIARDRQFDLPEMGEVRLAHPSVRGRVTRAGTLAYSIEADDMTPAGGHADKPEPAGTPKPSDTPKPGDGARPFGLK